MENNYSVYITEGYDEILFTKGLLTKKEDKVSFKDWYGKYCIENQGHREFFIFNIDLDERNKLLKYFKSKYGKNIIDESEV